MLNIGHHFLRYALAFVIGPIVTGITWMGFGLPKKETRREPSLFLRMTLRI